MPKANPIFSEADSRNRRTKSGIYPLDVRYRQTIRQTTVKRENKRAGSNNLLHRYMEELIEILIPEVELTITVTRERSALLLPKKLSDEMNLIEGDKLIPLKIHVGCIYQEGN